MKSVQLARALASGKVPVRTARNVTGQVYLKFRNPAIPDKIITAFPLADLMKPESFTNLALSYSAEALKNSNLEDLLLNGVLELSRS